MTQQKKLPISVVMVIFNEGELLERAIKSVIDSVDELIVVHDGKCNDTSLEIARKYTNQVFTLPHKGACEYHRIFTYIKAKNDWILQLDGDEYVSPELQKKLATLIKQNVGIYEVLWSTPYNGIQYLAIYKRSLFRKSQVYYIAAMHEPVKPVNTNIVIQQIHEPIYNDPDYTNMSMEIFNKKWVPWAKLQARDLGKPFHSLDKWNCTLMQWELTTKLRIDHPILLGILGSATYHAFFNFKIYVRTRSLYFLIQGFYKMKYIVLVYYFLYKLQHGKKI